MKKIATLFLLVLFAAASVMPLQGATKKKTKTRSAASSSMTIEKFADMLTSSESEKITDINALATEIDRAKAMTVNGLNKFIAAKYPASAKKPLAVRIDLARKAIETYTTRNEFQRSNAGIAEGLYIQCCYTDFCVIATLSELLDAMPTLESRQLLLKFGVELSIFTNNAASLLYLHAVCDTGVGSYLTTLSGFHVICLNTANLNMIRADLKALSSPNSTSTANPSTLFKKFVDLNSESTIDPEWLSEVIERYSDSYQEYRVTLQNISADYERLADAHDAWLQSLPQKQADAMANSLAILMKECVRLASSDN